MRYHVYYRGMPLSSSMAQVAELDKFFVHFDFVLVHVVPLRGAWLNFRWHFATPIFMCIAQNFSPFL